MSIKNDRVCEYWEDAQLSQHAQNYGLKGDTTVLGPIYWLNFKMLYDDR